MECFWIVKAARARLVSHPCCRYQIRLLLLCMPFTLFLAYAAYSPILFLYVPEHWCRPDPALSNRLLDWTEDQILEITSPKERDEGSGVVRRSRCQRYDVDFSKVVIPGRNSSDSFGFPQMKSFQITHGKTKLFFPFVTVIPE